MVKVTKQRVSTPISAHCGSSGAAIVTAYKSELFVITPLRRVQHCKVSCSHVSITEVLVSNFLGRIQYGTSFAKVPSFLLYSVFECVTPLDIRTNAPYRCEISEIQIMEIAMCCFNLEPYPLPVDTRVALNAFHDSSEGRIIL